MDNEPYMRFLVRSVLLNKDLLKYIVSFQGGRKYYDITDAHWVISNGHLSLLKERFQDLDYDYIMNPMDKAAAYGHLEIVKWLHENENEIKKITGYTVGTKQAMHYAAINGNFEIVKWLYFARNEGCSKWLLYETAYAGHFEIVKWLHSKYANDFFECYGLYVIAIRLGCLDTFVWVWENTPRTINGYEPFEYAIDNDSFEIIKWLCENNKVIVKKKHIYSAQQHGFSEIYLYLKSKIV